MNIKQQPTLDELLEQLQKTVSEAIISESVAAEKLRDIKEIENIRNNHKAAAVQQWDNIHDLLGRIHKMYRTRGAYSDSPGYMSSQLYKLLTFHEEGRKQQEKPDRRQGIVEIDQ